MLRVECAKCDRSGVLIEKYGRRRSSANPKKTFARCITPGGSLTCSPQVIVGMIVDHAHLRGDGFEKFCALGVALNTAGEHQQHVDLSTVERKRAH